MGRTVDKLSLLSPPNWEGAESHCWQVLGSNCMNWLFCSRVQGLWVSTRVQTWVSHSEESFLVAERGGAPRENANTPHIHTRAVGSAVISLTPPYSPAPSAWVWCVHNRGIWFRNKKDLLFHGKVFRIQGEERNKTRKVTVCPYFKEKKREREKKVNTPTPQASRHLENVTNGLQGTEHWIWNWHKHRRLNPAPTAS